jgi:hypothetical protein
MRNLKKTLIVLIITILGFVVMVIIFISPITKYLIEKYDMKYTGRQIKMDWAYVNPFTGYVHFSNVKIYELNSDSIFFSANGVNVNISLFNILSKTKTYEISNLTLNQPNGIISQNNKEYNFSDLIKNFSSKDSSEITKPRSHFNIHNVKIIDGIFFYRDKQVPINYFIKKVNIESIGMQWDTDTIAAKFSFLSGIGSGGMNGNFTINSKNKDYRLAIVVQKFELNILEQYLTALTNYGSYTANLDADLNVIGNFKAAENVTFSGLLAINDFHIGKNPKDDYASFKKLALSIEELSPKNHKYLFDSILLEHPYFKYEKYDNANNLQTMFAGKDSNHVTTKLPIENLSPSKFNLVLEIGNYIKKLAKNFFSSDYQINQLAINKGDLKFNDYSLSEKFSMDFNPITIKADSIGNDHKRAIVSIKSDIKPYGNISLAIRLNPKDKSYFNLQYQLQKFSATLLNPYIIFNTSFPLDRGMIESNGTWTVRNGNIQSNNHILIIDPRASRRIKNNATSWIPLWLIMFFVRERGNVIDYEIPITGNLKNPKFHLKDVLFDVLKNIFIKPATVPYGVKVKYLETEIEKSLTLKWVMRQSSLTSKQEKFIERMADFLVKNPDALITIHPQQYEIKEKEYILFYEAKKKYFLAINNKTKQSFNDVDSVLVDKMSVKDSKFVQYLHKKIDDSLLFTIQEKCASYLDNNIVNKKINQLNNDRKNVFIGFFRNRNVEKRIKFSEGENIIPFNGFSFYKIEYKGIYPESILNSYRKLDEYNNEAPRKKYRIERRNNKIAN